MKCPRMSQKITANAKIMGLKSSLKSFSAIFMSYRHRVKRKNSKIWKKNFFLKMRMIYIWSNRGRTVCISWKQVAVAKFPASQNFKTTFKQNLTCTFLSLRANSKNTVCTTLTDPVQEQFILNVGWQTPKFNIKRQCYWGFKVRPW